MGLFGKSVNVNKLLSEALDEYKRGNYAECLDKVSQAAATGNGRAEFCLALLQLNDNVTPADKQDEDKYLSILKQAVAHKYSLAINTMAKNLEDLRTYDELSKFCKEHKHCDVAMVQYCIAKEAMGSYSDDDDPPTNERVATAAAKKCLEAAQFAVTRLQKNDLAYVEAQTYNPFGTSADLYNQLGRAYFVNFRMCYWFSDSHTSSEIMRNYNEAMKYLSFGRDRFRLAYCFTFPIFANEMQLADISLANTVMKHLQEAYLGLCQEDKDFWEQSYRKAWREYDDFYDETSRRLAGRGIVYDNAVVNRNDLTAGNVLDALGSWSARTEQQRYNTREVYTIDGKTYTKDDYGYLCDEYGYRSEYRIDDVNRLHIGDSIDDVGYFNSDGLFIGK